MLAAAMLITPALAGCVSSAEPNVTVDAPTATVTATVTAAPAPEAASEQRSPDSALTELDAWLLCWGATSNEYGETSELYSYSADSPSGGSTVTDIGDGTFQVLVPFASEGRGAEAICIASGTVGAPSVDLQGGRDFG